MKMEPGLSELGTWYAGGGAWDTASWEGVAVAEVGAGAWVASAVFSVVAAVGICVGGAASTGGVVDEGGPEGAGEAEGAGGVGAVAVVPVGSVVAVSVEGPVTADGPLLSTVGSVVGGSSSAGGVGAFGSSEESRGAARRLLKDAGKAEAVELDWGTEKAGFVFDSGGLNKLPELTDTAPLDKSAAALSPPGFWGATPKLNCAAPLPRPSPLSTKLNEPGVGLVEGSLASSPWPTRSPEKLPSVSPPIALAGCGSILRGAEVEEGFTGSPDIVRGGVGDPVPRAGEADFGVRENGSSPVWPNPILPLAPKGNLFPSFTRKLRFIEETKEKTENNEGTLV